MKAHAHYWNIMGVRERKYIAWVERDIDALYASVHVDGAFKRGLAGSEALSPETGSNCTPASSSSRIERAGTGRALTR